MTTASKQTQAQTLEGTPEFTTGREGQELKILQELEQVGNNPNTSSEALSTATEKIKSIINSYGKEAVEPVIAQIVGTNAYGTDSVLNAYALVEGDLASESTAASTRDKGKLADVLLHKDQILEDNDSVVRDTEDADPTVGVSGDEFINLTSQTHQCVLQHYISDVAKYHRERLSRHDLGDPAYGWPAPGFPGSDIAPWDSNDKAKIILVDDSDPDSSVTPINALTSLGKTTGLSTLLPADLAKAMPKLRLYKIYRKNGKESGKVEFKFPTATDSGFLTDVATVEVDGLGFQVGNDFTMSPGYAKGRTAGIKSFDWSFVGGDPFTATRDLTAKLTIFFQDFRDLTLVRQGANLLDEKRELQPYKYLDLIVQPDCRGESLTASSTTTAARKTANKEMVFNPDCYEIAVEVGYADSTDLPLALKDRNDTLYLTMVEHSFDIGQDGTFSLSIDYRARLATLLGDKGMNVLSPGGGYMIKDSVDSTGLVFDIREVQQQIDAEESKSSPDKLELDALRATEKHLLYVRNNGLYRSISHTLMTRGMVYSMFLEYKTFTKFAQFNKYNREGGKNRLTGVDDIPPLPADGIGQASNTPGYQAVLDTMDTDIADAEDSDVMDDSAYSFKSKLKTDLYFTTVGNLMAVALDHITGESAISLGTQGDIEVIKNIHKAAQKDYDESIATSERLEKEAKEAAEPVTAGTTVDVPTSQTSEGQIYNVPPATASNNPIPINEAQRNILERFRIILGSVSYEDAITGETKAINIAHLPVSMQMFRQFMVDRVISNQRKFYSFQDFFRDILTDIVFDSLQRICFGGSIQGAEIRTGISLFNGQGTGAGGATEPITSLDKDELYGLRRPNPADKALYKSLSPAAANSKNPIFTNIVSNSALDFNYLMFTAFSVAALNKNLHGDEGEDNENGIAHFRYGSTTGMMKSISFSKTPLEFAAEERYVREGSDNLLNQLAGRYEMQMSLVGNNMFIPGQYVYFDPVALGIGKSMTNDGSSRSLANLMGLGGYHIITEVGCSIAPGKFETTIKALWETGGTPKPTTKPEGT